MTPGPTPACRPPAPKPSPERGTAHDQAFGDEIVELGQKGVDALGFVDDHDDDGEVLGKAEDAGGVDVAGGAVALQASDHRGTGQPRRVGAVHDLGEERLAMVLIGLTDEDREPLTRSFQPHGYLLLASMGHSRASPFPA
jgi:hypothetical protein